MKIRTSWLVVWSIGIVALGSRPVLAEDIKGRFGIGGIFEAVWPLGQESVKQQADNVGPGLGGWLRYGLSKHLSAAVSYENIHLGNDIRVEPVILQGIYSLMPDRKVSPTIIAGGGISRGVDAKNFSRAAWKGGLGLELFPNRNFAIGPQVTFHYVDSGHSSPRHLNALGGGLNATWFFGGAKEAAATPAAAAPVAAALVSVSASPSSVVLGPGASQSISAAVDNTSNKAVTWSINPPLGSVDANGVYTAPATVSFAQDVTVTATSVADPSKSATSIVRLTPPAAAPQTVSISLNVLFDTGKTVVKPAYKADIAKVAEFMQSYPGTSAEIAGYTDNVGSEKMNISLSQRRADAVRQYLIDNFGIDAARLTAKGYGPARPIADNKTVEGRAQNRRVVATLTATK